VTADTAFFREWDSRRPGQRRSLDRARTVRDLLGLAGHHPPVLTMVGSKGKGTAASYASAYLAAAGHRVVTVTSPSLRSTTERLRVDGTAVSGPVLARLGRVLAGAVRRLPPHRDGPGYLSPSGLFTLAGLLLARERSAGYLVLEAGRGGASDEVSLVDPIVVAVTPIFAEHLAELGGSPAAIVADKAGVVGPGTRAVVVGPQPDPATSGLVREQVAARTGGRLTIEELEPAGSGRPTGPEPEPAPAPLGGWEPAGPPDRVWPPGLGRANARLGCLAAARLLAATGRPPPLEPALTATLGSVRLPGRLSTHPVPGTGARVVLDAAVSPAGFRTALAYAEAALGGVDHVLLSLPDDKDLPGATAELAGRPVTFVPVPASHLRFTRPLPPGWHRLAAARLDPARLAGLGTRLLALGTVSFIGRLLDLLDAPTAVAFRPRLPRSYSSASADGANRLAPRRSTG
jgi:dihydrofolate synthase/folylpolyglutamate synthase